MIIGSIGYKEDREWWTTPVYKLDLEEFAIRRVETTGDGPGWISDHRASLQVTPTDTKAGPEYVFSIEVHGGQILGEDQKMRPNFDQFSLDLNSLVWTRKDRK